MRNLLIILFICTPVYADKVRQEYTTINNITQEYTDNVTHSSNECQGVAIAQATGNNQMYLGTNKPQLSLGLGNCQGEVAGSLMFGAKPGRDWPMINGSIAADNDVTAVGVGGTWIFQ